MPGDKSPPIRGFFDAIRKVVQGGQHPAAQVVGQVVGAYAPRCHVCQKTALVPARCLLCGHTPCEEHGFFHALGVGLCTPCLEESGIELDLAGLGFGPAGGAADAGGFPWSSLGIAPTRDVQAIKRAFRKLATEDHPDHHREGTKEHAQATESFKRLKAAYDDALSIAQGE
jgi:DnaJ-like protein